MIKRVITKQFGGGGPVEPVGLPKFDSDTLSSADTLRKLQNLNHPTKPPILFSLLSNPLL